MTKEEQRRNPLNQQAIDTAMQERMQFGAEDGGYSYACGGAQSGDNLGNAKRGGLVSMTLEEGEHATQEVCQIQFQIQNSRHDETEARKKENSLGEEGKENNQNMGPAQTFMSTIGCENGVSGLTHMGRVEAKNIESQKVNSPVKMDIGLSLEKENNDVENKTQKKKGKLKKLARGQNKEFEMGRDAASNIVGVKRTLWADEEMVDGGRQKKFCDSNTTPFELSVVSAEQHRWEP